MCFPVTLVLVRNRVCCMFLFDDWAASQGGSDGMVGVMSVMVQTPLFESRSDWRSA